MIAELAAPGGPFAPAACAERDDREEFPAAAVAALDALGVAAQYVPARLGGAWRDHDELVGVVRAIARHDLTVAVAHAKTFLGAVCVWLAGTDRQQAALAADVLAGVPVAWGLTEPAHGSDLLATGLEAVPDGDGYRLTGVKRPINNATRGDLICLLARTSEAAGPRALSLLLVDKRTLPAGTWTALPKVPTHGIRGADISGIALTGAPVGADAVVGAPGTGLETVLRALQLTRVLATALSLGAADHAVELVRRYVHERHLYERHLIEMPHIRRTVGEIRARARLAEAVTVLTARCAHTLTGELAVQSALTKAFVPALVDELIAAAAEVLGARAFLTGVWADGAFAKLDRDHRIVAIFDGNTAVNRNAVINHFPALVRGWRERPAVSPELRVAADPGAALPELGGLGLTARTGCAVVQQMPAAVAGLPDRVRPLGAALVEVTDRLHAEMAAVRPSVRDVPAEAFELAERYEWCFAAASAIHRGGPGLAAMLTLALDRLGADLPADAYEVFDEEDA